MLNFRNTTIGFIVLIVILGIYQVYSKASFSIYGIAVIPYIFLLVYGSYFVGSGFYMPVICRGASNQKLIALSFDDGPDQEFTPVILDILKKNSVEAAFFSIGKRVETHPTISKEVIEQGHMIGNHSYSHAAWFDLFSFKRMKADLDQMDGTLEVAIGLRPKLFRPPYGVTNPNLNRAVREGNYKTIGWNIRSFDTVIHNREKLLRRILSRLKPGSIILLHDTSATTVAILPDLIKQIKDRGYVLTRLDKMLNLEAYA